MKANIKIDASAFSKNLYAIQRRSQDGKKLNRIMKDSVKPWRDELKGEMYSARDRQTGDMKRGITTRNMKRRFGVITGPSPRSKGGWRVHFFTKGSKQVGRSKQIDFQKVYARRTALVKRKFRENLINFVFKPIR